MSAGRRYSKIRQRISLRRASGGAYFYSNEAATSGVVLTPGSGAWANLSDRYAKTGVVPLDDDSILANVAALPASGWSYKSEAGVRHVGPMAQDFYAAFGVGVDDRHITSIDEDGVALAAIKGLNAKLERSVAENRALRARLFCNRKPARRALRAWRKIARTGIELPRSHRGHGLRVRSRQFLACRARPG